MEKNMQPEMEAYEGDHNLMSQENRTLATREQLGSPVTPQS